MLNLHLLLVTLHMRFTISIEQDKNRLGDTKYNIGVVFTNHTSFVAGGTYIE